MGKSCSHCGRIEDNLEHFERFPEDEFGFSGYLCSLCKGPLYNKTGASYFGSDNYLDPQTFARAMWWLYDKLKGDKKL